MKDRKWTPLVFLVIVIAGIALSFVFFVTNELPRYLYYARALSIPGVIAACMPNSLFFAEIFGLFFLMLYSLYAILNFERKKRLRKWTLIFPLLTLVFLLPQMHGQICLYEDGRLVKTGMSGKIVSEHSIEEVRRTTIRVNGRMYHAKGGKTPGSISLELTYSLIKDREAYTFGVDSFKGETGSERFTQMLKIRQMVPQENVVIKPYTQDNLQEAFDDEGLVLGDWAAVRELLSP